MLLFALCCFALGRFALHWVVLLCFGIIYFAVCSSTFHYVAWYRLSLLPFPLLWGGLLCVGVFGVAFRCVASVLPSLWFVSFVLCGSSLFNLALLVPSLAWLRCLSP